MQSIFSEVPAVMGETLSLGPPTTHWDKDGISFTAIKHRLEIWLFFDQTEKASSQSPPLDIFK